MRKLVCSIAVFVFLCSSCGNNKQDVPNTLSDSNNALVKNAPVPINIPVEPPAPRFVVSEDTTISYAIEGISGEGSEVKAHYLLDSIKTSTWEIYGETGKSIIKYDFTNKDTVKADEKNYSYTKPLMQVESDKDMKLKSKLTYSMDRNGKLLTKVNQPGFENLFKDFKKVVPLVLKKKK